jgi:hypothetical protein
LAYCMAIWYTFPRFGMLRQEKSGSPVWIWPTESLSDFYESGPADGLRRVQ